MPALPDGVRNKLLFQCMTSAYAARTASLKSSPSMLSLQTKFGGLILEKKGSSARGGLGVLGSDETVAEESIVEAPDEGGIALSCAISGVSVGRPEGVLDDGSPETSVASLIRAGKVVEDPLRAPVVEGAAVGVL